VTAGTSGELPHRQIQITTPEKEGIKACNVVSSSRGHPQIFQTCPRASSSVVNLDDSIRRMTVWFGPAPLAFATLLPWRCMGSDAPHVYPAGSSLHNSIRIIYNFKSQ
jgi:hypothetical protein